MKHALSLIVGLVLLTTVRPLAQQSLSVRDLVGTWTLESTQQGFGTPQQAAVPNPRGLVIFDGAGHVFEALTRSRNQGQGQGGGRGQAQGGQAQAPTPAPRADAALSDAQRRFAEYSGFWGGYRLDGGKMWRITPMMNWHLSDNIRFELGYGYAELDRFDRQGHTQFVQSRLQLTL